MLLHWVNNKKFFDEMTQKLLRQISESDNQAQWLDQKAKKINSK